MLKCEIFPREKMVFSSVTTCNIFSFELFLLCYIYCGSRSIKQSFLFLLFLVRSFNPLVSQVVGPACSSVGRLFSQQPNPPITTLIIRLFLDSKSVSQLFIQAVSQLVSQLVS